MDAPWEPDRPTECIATFSGEPCDRPVKANGLCSTHSSRKKYGYDMDAPEPHRNKGIQCSATIQGEPCGNDAKALGLCYSHYNRQKIGFDMDAPWQTFDPDRFCKATIQGEPCTRSAISVSGMCDGHEMRVRRGSDMDAPWIIIDPNRPCTATVEGRPCDRPYSRGGFCAGHYIRSRRGSDMEAPWIIVDPERGCTIDGCERGHKSLGLCPFHYLQIQKERRLDAQVEPNGFTAERLVARLAMYGRTCWICGEEIDDEPGEFHLDHVKPISAGGAHTPANLRPAHRLCNITKQAAWPIDTSTAHLRLDPARLP
jgi:hypothetical protein